SQCQSWVARRLWENSRRSDRTFRLFSPVGTPKQTRGGNSTTTTLQDSFKSPIPAIDCGNASGNATSLELNAFVGIPAAEFNHASLAAATGGPTPWPYTIQI